MVVVGIFLNCVIILMVFLEPRMLDDFPVSFEDIIGTGPN